MTWDGSIHNTVDWNKASQGKAESECSFCVGDLETRFDFTLKKHHRFWNEVLCAGVNLKFVNQVEISAILLVSFNLQASNRPAAGRQNQILEGDL